MEHRAIFVSNTDNKVALLQRIKNSEGAFAFLKGLDGKVYSSTVMDHFLEEEARHDNNLLAPDSPQALHTLSSGEKRKALFRYLMSQDPDYLVLDNPMAHLDRETQEAFRKELVNLSASVLMVQLLSRKEDLLPFITLFSRASDSPMGWQKTAPIRNDENKTGIATRPIPMAPTDYKLTDGPLFKLTEVTVRYGEKPVLKNINWHVRPGEFWELSGANGSGKTTILSMITGDNPKAYGQEIEIMGIRKGSGESIWDLKKYIGYFSPAVTYRFRGYHSVLNMLISGLYDSIGLYVKPVKSDIDLAHEWIELLGLGGKKQEYFHDLSEGEQRLVMCARAMIKHPPLLILDEPTVSLDDVSAKLVVALVNKMARESEIAIVFVSHRPEANLTPDHRFHLEMTKDGSIGIKK